MPDLLELINSEAAAVAVPAPPAADILTRGRRIRRRRRTTAGLGAAAAAAVVGLTATYVTMSAQPDERLARPAAVAPGVVGMNPALKARLILDAPGWVVPSFSGSVTDDARGGDIVYEPSATDNISPGSSATPRLTISWNHASGYGQALKTGAEFDTTDASGKPDGHAEPPLDVLGATAHFWSVTGGRDVGDRDNKTHKPVLTQDAYRVVLPPKDGWFQSIEGSALSRADFQALIGKLHWADQAAFDAALPQRYYTSTERETVTKELLHGIPLPETYDAHYLTSLQPNRYHLALDLAKGAVCVWGDELRAATRAGDRGRTDRAKGVLDDAGSWPIGAELKGSDVADLLTHARTYLENDRDWLGCR